MASWIGPFAARCASTETFARLVPHLLLAMVIGGAPGLANAGEITFRVFHHGVESDFSVAGDVDGHVLGHFSRKGIALFEDGTIGSYTNGGTFDFTKGAGTYVGYATITLEDGSFTTTYFEGETTIAEDGTRNLKGTGKYVNGGGRFEGIKGDITHVCTRSAGFVKAEIDLNSCDITANQILP